MLNFIKTLLSNRFGIILATLNVCGFLFKSNELFIWCIHFRQRFLSFKYARHYSFRLFYRI